MSTYFGVNARLAKCRKCESGSSRFQPGDSPEEKALVGAFSVIVQLHRLIVYTALVITPHQRRILCDPSRRAEQRTSASA